MTPDSGSTITRAGFARFYWPLVATSYLLTATNPLLAAALARTTSPATALAGYGVAFAFIGVGSSGSVMFFLLFVVLPTAFLVAAGVGASWLAMRGTG